MKAKYVIYVVDATDIEKGLSKVSYDEAKNLAIDHFEADTLEEMLSVLVRGLNNSEVSDENFYFLVDERAGIILTSN